MYLKASKSTKRISARIIGKDGSVEGLAVAEFDEDGVAEVSEADGKALLRAFPKLKKLTAAKAKKQTGAAGKEAEAADMGREAEE
jgi:hypothetical protein